MFLNMRRLHPRGAANRGISVDADGAMLGPACVLVRRTSHGFRGIERGQASALQKCVFAADREPDWLFRQSQRIAEALDKGELALAQIHGLHIPIIEFDDHLLALIAPIDFARAYNPDEPRLPKGDPNGGELTTGGAPDGTSVNAYADLESDGGGDGGEGDDRARGESSDPPAPGDDPPPADEPPIKFTWPNESPPVGATSGQHPSSDGGPTTLGSPDLGDRAPDAASPPGDDQPPPNDSTGASSGSDASSISPPPDIPAIEPSTTQQINTVLRGLATWLGRALAVLGAAYELDPRVQMLLAAIEATVWLADYLPKIFSYLDDPKTLEDLRTAATRPAPPGYEIHHIVEAQKGSDNPQSNARTFPDLIDSPANLVRIPYWKHVEISSWYSTINEDYNGLSPRDYLRGKSWEEQYEIGLKALRRFGVLK